ncbi:AlpA family phage regulatory protein, partial [Aeromonas caviae]
MNNTIKVLRIKDLINKIGIGRSTIYDWLNPQSPRFNA